MPPGGLELRPTDVEISTDVEMSDDRRVVDIETCLDTTILS